jgi:hypothetical protein
MVVYRGSRPSGPIDSVAIKQLYASHYFETALDLSVCVSDNSQPHGKGFYLITVKGSRQAGLTGPKGAIVRPRLRNGSLRRLRVVETSWRNRGRSQCAPVVLRRDNFRLACFFGGSSMVSITDQRISSLPCIVNTDDISSCQDNPVARQVDRAN